MGPVQVRPLTPTALAAFVVSRALALELGHPVRIAIDGPPQADPGALADAVYAAARDASLPAARVRLEDFLRPASVRFEYGHTDPDGWYDAWADVGGLLREVLVPLGPGGSLRYLPTLWDASRDRATRAPYESAPPSMVLVVDGQFLLRHELRWEFDLTVHLALSAGAVRRRTAAGQEWQWPALQRYDDETAPEDNCDILVRYDDPRHPAVVER
jgi:hypothetical protein